MLDIRYIGERLWNAHNAKLYYMAFNKDAESQELKAYRNSREASIKLNAYIDETSQTVLEDFRNVAEDRDLTQIRITDQAPFHAINLDLCDSVAKRRGDMSNYFKLIELLYRVQARSNDPSLLFVTTRIDPESADEDLRNKLIEGLQKAVDSCECLRNNFCKEWRVNETGDRIVLDQHADAHELLALGIVQWAVYMAVSYGLKPTLKSFMSYRVYKDHRFDDLLSFSLCLEPDCEPKSPLSMPGAVSIESEEDKSCRLSGRIPRKIRQCKSVDELLANDPSLFDECVEQTRDLLSECNYDMNEYNSFLRDAEGQLARLAP